MDKVVSVSIPVWMDHKACMICRDAPVQIAQWCTADLLSEKKLPTSATL